MMRNPETDLKRTVIHLAIQKHALLQFFVFFQHVSFVRSFQYWWNLYCHHVALALVNYFKNMAHPGSRPTVVNESVRMQHTALGLHSCPPRTSLQKKHFTWLKKATMSRYVCAAPAKTSFTHIFLFFLSFFPFFLSSFCSVFIAGWRPLHSRLSRQKVTFDCCFL